MISHKRGGGKRLHRLSKVLFWRTRTTVESCFCIDIRQWSRQGLLIVGLSSFWPVDARKIHQLFIAVRETHVQFTYGAAYEPPYLYQKSRFLTEDFPHYPEQLAFEQALEAQHLFDFREGHGPTPQVFEDRLKAARLEVEGFALRPTRTLPSLDEKCGKHFTFREFITAGETQTRTGIPNIPEQAETYNALVQLATLVLDPLIDYFGDIILTYGFCSRELAKVIPGRIAPSLDQHVSHELNSRGKPICLRLGAAVDFLVTDENMLEVAQWIVQHTPFDRLYFYGDTKPLHVSYGPEKKGEVVVLKESETGRRAPKVLQSSAFLALGRAEIQ